MRTEYYSLANHKLPGSLSQGFVKAMKVYRQKHQASQEDILCVVDIQKPALVFALGDECSGIEDEAVFFVHKCEETLVTCARMAETIDTLNIGQESCHWLTDAIAIAEGQGAFDDLEADILGAFMYDEYDMDVIYSGS